MNEVTLQLQGMHCASCANRVERVLNKISGIRNSSVNFAMETARIELESASLADVTDTLAKAGYLVRETHSQIAIAGMHCASCVTRIEEIIRKIPGVTSANVNFAVGSALVGHLSSLATAADIARAITDSGYEAKTIDAEASDKSKKHSNAEIEQPRNLMVMALSLSLPVFVIEMGGHAFPAFHHWLHSLFGQSAIWTFQFLLATLVLAIPGRKFFTSGIPALLRGAPDMNALVAIGTGAAWSFSTLSLFAPTLLPEGTRAVYFEAAAAIVTIILLGRWLEHRARARTGEAIKGLLDLQPRIASVKGEDGFKDTPIDELRVGDIVRVRPGERIAVDGKVIEGRADVVEAMITGEPMPVSKSAGDSLIGGTLNGNSALFMRATGVGKDMMLAQIVTMVRDAQTSKLPIQSLADKVVAYFVPAVLAVAAITIAAWLTFGPTPALGLALVAGVSVLIIACPCAMGLATPTSIMVSTGIGAESGLLFRKGDAIQRLAEASVVVFDKTGTLTVGSPRVTDVSVIKPYSNEDVLALVAAVETQSEHPIARAIETAAVEAGLTLPTAKDFQALPGRGVSARVGEHQVLLGTARHMSEEGLDLSMLDEARIRFGKLGHTLVHVAIDGQAAALIAVSDPIKRSSKATIEALHKAGIKTSLMTGDTEIAGRSVAAQIGIQSVMAEVLPGDKHASVRTLQRQHGVVAFVGDGINDAPALAAADIGIAMGSGTDVAIDAADLVLVSGDPMGVVKARHLSCATLRNIKQNLFWAFAYNTALIPVAAGILFPLTGQLLSPVLAATAMALSSIFVLGNALRLRGVKSELERYAV
ncbi:MAG: heavy metal translocating P-type ATPase [Pseudomonadota bacterium]